MMGAAHTESDVDVNKLSQIIKVKSGKRLLWEGYKIDPKTGVKIKNQRWENTNVNFATHVTGEEKQGGCLSDNGECTSLVVDIDDKKIDIKKICEEAWNYDYKVFPFQSPSGRIHLWKFFHTPQPIEVVAKEAKKLERHFKKLGHSTDPGKTQPTETGSQIGINFPFATKEQYPFTPTGIKLNWKQFLHRYRFLNLPLVAAATGMHNPGRTTALLKIAALFEQKQIMHHLDEVINNFGEEYTDIAYINRIKDKKIHEKYKNISAKGIAAAITDIVGFDYALPAAPDEYKDAGELEIFEHTGLEKIKKRPWLIHGLLLERALTLVVGQPGVGKTMLLHMLAYALATGNLFLAKDVLVRGNVLGLFAEETSNESDIRWCACKQTMGKNDGKFKLYKRGLEHDLKLVKFTKEAAKATEQYQQLRNTIKKHNIKYIVLDPLINFQTGSYDENSNQNMDAYVKNYLIPLAVEMNGAVIAGHHTNKLSMVSSQDNQLLVDNQNALMAARGASSLIGAARFVLALQPMTKKLWDQYFKEHITDGTNFVHYTGLIEAKSNYNMVEADIAWLRKDSIDVPTDDGFSESTGAYAITELNKLTKAKNKLKAAQNLVWCKSKLPTIQKLMADAKDDTITLNSIVLELLPLEPDFADQNINENTIKTKVRRKLENGFSGAEETKDGFVRSGIECDDGYNYWLHRNHGATGAAKVFIRRAIDFKRKNKR